MASKTHHTWHDTGAHCICLSTVSVYSVCLPAFDLPTSVLGLPSRHPTVPPLFPSERARKRALRLLPPWHLEQRPSLGRWPCWPLSHLQQNNHSLGICSGDMTVVTNPFLQRIVSLLFLVLPRKPTGVLSLPLVLHLVVPCKRSRLLRDMWGVLRARPVLACMSRHTEHSYEIWTSYFEAKKVCSLTGELSTHFLGLSSNPVIVPGHVTVFVGLLVVLGCLFSKSQLVDAVVFWFFVCLFHRSKWWKPIRSCWRCTVHPVIAYFEIHDRYNLSALLCAHQ